MAPNGIYSKEEDEISTKSKTAIDLEKQKLYKIQGGDVSNFNRTL